MSPITACSAAVVLLLLTAGCIAGTDEPVTQPTSELVASSAPEVSAPTEQQDFPDVVDAALEPRRDGWRLSATISSPYDTPERYADAFRARTEDGEVLGIRELLHDHAGEQPFTRSLEDLVIPDGVDRIVIEGRDLANGWGGTTVTLDVPPG